MGRNKRGLRAALAALTLAAALSWPAFSPARAELTSADVQTYRQAFKAAEQGRFAEARQIADRAREDLPAKVIRWLDLTRPTTDADFRTLADFLEKNPDWPNQAALKRNAEGRMQGLSDKEVLSWFRKNPPLTTAGFLRHVDALLATGDSATATRLVRERYVQGTFGAVEERDYRRRFTSILRPQDHWARLDRLLWDEDEAGAQRVMPLVDKGRQNLALARLALAGMSGGVDGAIRRIPSNLVDDPGLAYERLRWRRRKDMDAGALEALAKPPKDLGRPEAWWTERHIMARRLIEKGQYQRAYQLAVAHGTTEGLPFAQAEFLSGWLALRFLKKPDVALRHFETLYRGVGTPISKSRGAYWAGRAAQTLGDKERAKTWFQIAAAHGTTFYGLLAADELGMPPAAAIPRAPEITAEQRGAFEKRELVRVARMMARIQGSDGSLTELFLRRMAIVAKSDADYSLTARLAEDLGRPDLAVTTARQGLQDGWAVVDGGYPLLDRKLAARPEPALVHAIVRQESTFDSDAVSPAGARGLMQMMPATAQHLAKQLGVKHTHEKLTADPDYNVRLGSTYMLGLLERFGGSYVLAIAAYNAGQGRVAGWLRDIGDPRSGSMDVVDWIETIPIYETRNYVQRVMENLHVYRTRLGAPPLSMTDDLKRGSAGAG
ncbi:lytic transglycosylase domain-containing protein [Rhodospirillum centenum]|uniref:Lytic murein transglycosylase family protein n=1 Tax=Rhodospirillum centenum (strain ATCC 51521 / SW) TaxID=414684 RepID=B6IN14_RHOCS|nr:lytic transglycosylase domain-containing protein [Rhodospirillum centenum]ACI98911.1 lytic murein transglycosylase family protein [Rhodospirillum centenum SW]